jgi:hypothetical protein
MEINQNETTVKEWFYESSDDQEMGVETKLYDNGQRMRRAKLSTGEIAVARRLKGKEVSDVNRMMGGDSDRYRNVIIAKCVTIDEKAIVPEDLDEMWMDDVNTLMLLASVNFPTAQKP